MRGVTHAALKLSLSLSLEAHCFFYLFAANPIYPYQNDTQIDCSSRVGVFPKIRLINQDIKIFGISRNSFYVCNLLFPRIIY